MRVLFVVGSHLPKPSANGVCVMRVQEALLKIGIASDVITEGSEEKAVPFRDCGQVFYVKLANAETGRRNKLFSFLSKCLRAFFWPVKTPGDILKYRRMIRSVMSKQCYDMIIALLRPINGALACAMTGEYVLLELDSIANNAANEHGIGRWLSHRARFIEGILYKRAKYILHLTCHKEFYTQRKYRKYARKSAYFGTPQLVRMEKHDSEKGVLNTDVIRFIYTGVLDRSFRSPEYVINLIAELSSRMPLQCDFYSKGNCETLVQEAAQRISSVNACGYVDLNVLDTAISQSDVLVSIGNCFSGKVTSLPSKIISYMATGMPILHIDGGRNDVAKEYLQKYPLALIIDPVNSLSQNIEAVTSFIRENRGKRIPFDVVCEQFPMNMPEYTAGIIRDIIQNNQRSTIKTLQYTHD